MLIRTKPRNVSRIPKIFVNVTDEPKTKTDTIDKITKFAEYTATLYPGLGARLIDFTAKTVAATEKMPIKIAIIKDWVVIENSILGDKITSIEIAAVPYKIRETKYGFSDATYLNKKLTKKYPIKAMIA